LMSPASQIPRAQSDSILAHSAPSGTRNTSNVSTWPSTGARSTSGGGGGTGGTAIQAPLGRTSIERITCALERRICASTRSRRPSCRHGNHIGGCTRASSTTVRGGRRHAPECAIDAAWMSFTSTRVACAAAGCGAAGFEGRRTGRLSRKRELVRSEAPRCVKASPRFRECLLDFVRWDRRSPLDRSAVDNHRMRLDRKCERQGNT
jgi:hypothetical protein